MANYLAYRIVWTSPNLPYNSSYRQGKEITAGDVIWSSGGEISAGTHSAEYALPWHETVSFSAYLQGQRVNYTRISQYKDTNLWYTRAYYYWTNVDAQFEFYEGDFTSTDPDVSDLPITSIENNNETTEVITKYITAIAKIDGAIIAKDCIELNIMPDETDYGIYLKCTYIDSSTHEIKSIDSSTEDASIYLPENNSFSKNIKVYCPSYDASPKGGNTISPGSFVYEGDDLIYENCEITVDSSYKNGNISVNFNQDDGIIYKNYSGTFIITGASKNSPEYTTKVQIDFNADPEADFFTLNIPNQFVLTYGQEASIEAQFTTIPGLSFTCSVDNNISRFVDDSSIADGIIKVKHDERRLYDTIQGNITIHAVEITTDEMGIITNVSEPFQSKTVRITFDKIIMPDSIVLIINQIQKRIYFEVEEYDETFSPDPYTEPVHLGEDSSAGTSYTLSHVYPAQGNENDSSININDFTRKFRLTCYGSDWHVESISENWIQTTLDEGGDYEKVHAKYKFAVWVSPNPTIWKRTGKIKIVSDETKMQGNEEVPRAIIYLNVEQEGAQYEPDFDVVIVPKLETNENMDASVNSAFTLVPVYGKEYMIKVTNNCTYDALHIVSAEIETQRTTGLDYMPKPTDLANQSYPVYPDMDRNIAVSSVNPPAIRIDVPVIYGQAYEDGSTGTNLPGPTERAINLQVSALGVIDSQDSVLNKYMSIKITAYNESQGDSSANYKVANTDPRQLHQTGALRLAAYEGYDERPEVIAEVDKIRSFNVTPDIVALQLPYSVFSVRTGFKIENSGVNGDTGSYNEAALTTFLNNNINKYGPKWNGMQIFDDRCIVVLNKDLDEFLLPPSE